MIIGIARNSRDLIGIARNSRNFRVIWLIGVFFENPCSWRFIMTFLCNITMANLGGLWVLTGMDSAEKASDPRFNPKSRDPQTSATLITIHQIPMSRQMSWVDGTMGSRWIFCSNFKRNQDYVVREDFCIVRRSTTYQSGFYWPKQTWLSQREYYLPSFHVVPWWKCLSIYYVITAISFSIYMNKKWTCALSA